MKCCHILAQLHATSVCHLQAQEVQQQQTRPCVIPCGRQQSGGTSHWLRGHAAAALAISQHLVLLALCPPCGAAIPVHLQLPTTLRR